MYALRGYRDIIDIDKFLFTHQHNATLHANRCGLDLAVKPKILGKLVVASHSCFQKG